MPGTHRMLLDLRIRPHALELHLPYLTWRRQTGSNRWPAVYKKYGPVHPCSLAAHMTRIIALMALITLGLSGAPVHEPVHAESPAFPGPVTLRNIRARVPGSSSLFAKMGSTPS